MSLNFYQQIFAKQSITFTANKLKTCILMLGRQHNSKGHFCSKIDNFSMLIFFIFISIIIIKPNILDRKICKIMQIQTYSSAIKPYSLNFFSYHLLIIHMQTGIFVYGKKWNFPLEIIFSCCLIYTARLMRSTGFFL